MPVCLNSGIGSVLCVFSVNQRLYVQLEDKQGTGSGILEVRGE